MLEGKAVHSDSYDGTALPSNMQWVILKALAPMSMTKT